MAKTSPKSKRERRRRRVRAKISGTAGRPRLSVFRSNKHIYVQLIDDVADKTLFGLSDGSFSAAAKAEKFSAKVAQSFLVGEELAKQALVKKIKEVVFDRGGYAYAGRVKALAEGARRGGLKF